MWVVVGIVSAILGLGIYNATAGRGELLAQNQQLTCQLASAQPRPSLTDEPWVDHEIMNLAPLPSKETT